MILKFMININANLKKSSHFHVYFHIKDNEIKLMGCLQNQI